MNTLPIRAAQYIRMSTDHQDLSPDMQKAAIKEYAERKGISVVETYFDDGKSGVTLQKRPAMKRLLADVTRPERTFSVILVLDVTRWGRFQDVDQAAYHEYHCRLHGVNVHYVAEPFSDASSLFASLVKGLKRFMAADFSRELSVKTRAGQHAAIGKGFQLGSLPPLGFDRVAVSKGDGRQRPLRRDEHKAGNREHVRWVLGPASEVQAVRRIFQLYAGSKGSVLKLATRLQSEGVRNRYGDPITVWNLYTLLRSEAVLGNFVWGRADPDKKRRSEGDARVVRVQGIVRPMVSVTLFERVQAKLNDRSHLVFTKTELLECLRAAIAAAPNVRGEQLRKHGCPCGETYVKHFGSIRQAWAAAGAEYPARLDAAHYADRNKTARASAALCTVVRSALKGIGIQCTSHTRPDRRGQRLLINGRAVLRVQAIWKRERYPGVHQWELRKAASGYFDWALVIRLGDNGTPLDSFLLRQDEYYRYPKWLDDSLPGEWKWLQCGDELASVFATLRPCPPWDRRMNRVAKAPLPDPGES